MPQNGYSVGRDVSVDINGGQSGTIRFRVKTGFQAKPTYVDIKVRRLDGIVDNVVIPDGWGGTLDYERADDRLDTYFANAEANYYSGLAAESITIAQSITNPDGSNSQYLFEGVVLKYEDPGDWQSDKTVKQKLNWMATRRIKTL